MTRAIPFIHVPWGPNDFDAFNTPLWGELARACLDAPSFALAELLPLIDGLSDDELCWVGVGYVEAIIDCGWPGIRPELEAALAQSANLRKAASCAGPQDDEAWAIIERSLRPGEDVGRQSTSE